MARAATTTDVFNAIAEPWRRRILEALADGEGHSVTQVVEALGIAQPSVSKHLGVLREVGIVSVTKQRQTRLYRLNPQELKPVQDWLKIFERFWKRNLDSLKERAEKNMLERITGEKK
ncbi:MAG: metalloregulator ArsR/SmtB family transcription factor [Bryobacteraceae bacterium]|nr:metalloregulator ArsR/SmtB family transcription factor [Bryobacteraceae bacterium]